MLARTAALFLGMTMAVVPQARLSAENVRRDADLQRSLVAESEAFMNYWMKGDVRQLADILATDFIYASPQGVSTRGQALDVIAHCQLTSYSFSNLQMLRLSADSAVLVYRLKQDLTCFGKKDPPDTLNSDTFVKRGGKWKIVLTTQTTLVPNQA